MPIYEFRCLECNEVFELLFMSSEDTREMVCPHCGAEDLERVMSAASFSMAPSSGGGGPRTTASTRTCSTGTCGTLEIPGRGD